jgi:signal transduction histidine kinase
LNLTDNAMKYTPPGTRVVLRGGRDSSGLWLAVEDEGPGLSSMELERVFKPHNRGPDTVGRPGQGMGLPLARRLIERQGGTLTATSAPGQGCCFRIWLPELR